MVWHDRAEKRVGHVYAMQVTETCSVHGRTSRTHTHTHTHTHARTPPPPNRRADIARTTSSVANVDPKANPMLDEIITNVPKRRTS
jgi:hypothetical protein